MRNAYRRYYKNELVPFLNQMKANDFTYYEHGFMGNKSEIIREAPHNIFFKEIKEFIKK